MGAREWPLIVGIVALLGACATGGRWLSAPPAGVDLAGSWRYNAEASDPDPTLEAGSHGNGGGPPRGMGGRGMGGGRAGGRGAMGGRAGGFSPPLILPPVDELVLVQTDSAMTFRFGSKQAVVVPTDGRKVETTLWPGAGELEVSARWTEEGLHLERRRPGGGSMVQVLGRNPGSSRLLMTARIRTPRGDRTLNRVYDRRRGTTD